MNFQRSQIQQSIWVRAIVFGTLIPLILCLSRILAPLAPFSIGLCVALCGRSKSVLTALLAEGLLLGVAHFWPEAYFASFFLAVAALVGFLIGEVMLRKIHPVKGLMLVGAVLVLLCSASFAGYFVASHTSPHEQVVKMIEEQKKAITPEQVQVLKEGNKDVKELYALLSRPDELASKILAKAPPMIFIGIFFWVWANMFLLLIRKRGLMDKSRDYPYTERDLLEFKVPDRLVWGVIAVLIPILLDGAYVGAKVTIIAKGILFCLAIFYFFQGFGIFVEFLRFLRLPRFVRTLVLLLTVLTSMWFIPILGLLNVWVDFRKIFRKNLHKGDMI